MIAATRRPTVSANELITCYATWTAIHNDNVNIRNNLCQGSHMHGFVLPHIPCSSLSNSPYTNNTVGSANTGFIFNKIGESCEAITEVKAYACNIGQICSPAGPSTLMVTNVMVADSGRAVTLRFGGDTDDQTAYFEDSFITAISRPTCT